MKMISLYSGIEGFGLAGNWLGWDLVASVEKDNYCQSIIRQHFPNTIIYSDTHTFSGLQYANGIDILTAGFPCQKFSLNGTGTLDLSEWEQVFRILLEVKTPWVVCENVYGLAAQKDGLAINKVLSDLEFAGYEPFPPILLPAYVAGKPHERYRFFIVAYSEVFGLQRSRKIGEQKSYTHERQILPKCSAAGIDWKQWEAEPLLSGKPNGFPDWVDQVKSLGNAIVPQLFYEIGNIINTIHYNQY